MKRANQAVERVPKSFQSEIYNTQKYMLCEISISQSHVSVKMRAANKWTAIFRAAILCALLFATGEVGGHATGAGSSACQTMVPGHGKPVQTPETNPWQLSLDKTVLEAGGSKYVSFALEGKPGAKEEDEDEDGEPSVFQGFMIQARNEDSDELAGEFFDFG